MSFIVYNASQHPPPFLYRYDACGIFFKIKIFLLSSCFYRFEDFQPITLPPPLTQRPVTKNFGGLAPIAIKKSATLGSILYKTCDFYTCFDIYVSWQYFPMRRKAIKVLLDDEEDEEQQRNMAFMAHAVNLARQCVEEQQNV
jgi:hypothetical protein